MAEADSVSQEEAVAMEDNRFSSASRIKKKHLKELGLHWFAKHIDEGYFVEESVSISVSEQEAFRACAKTCYEHYEQGLEAVFAKGYDPAFGLSAKLWSLAETTFRQRGRYQHIFGRFDIAGITNRMPGQLIEFNADTATVLAEAALVQLMQLGKKPQWNEIIDHLAAGLKEIAGNKAPEETNVLIMTMGGGEDDDNATVWKLAAEQAGLYCDIGHLPSVTFSEEEGVFRQLNEDEWIQYGIVVKMFPWDWIDREEPELLDLLIPIVENDLATIINPPYTSLMQSKGMLVALAEQFPDSKHILRAGWDDRPTGIGSYVSKPLFGREGENVRVYNGNGLREEAEGDYGDQPRIWQQFVELPKDSDGDLYQAGVYWAKLPCGIAYRRRDGLIIDEDAEFIAHQIKD
ncbi:MAG: glutathionylspermidine synthase family protein [Saprospiraceae bacterium]